MYASVFLEHVGCYRKFAYCKIPLIRGLHWLQKFTVLNRAGHWHQQFERALSWDIATLCNLSRQKFNTTQWVWLQIPSHTSPPEYRGNKKNTSRRDVGNMKNIQLFFINKNITSKNISHAFNLPWKIIHCWNVHQKNNRHAEKHTRKSFFFHLKY